MGLCEQEIGDLGPGEDGVCVPLDRVNDLGVMQNVDEIPHQTSSLGGWDGFHVGRFCGPDEDVVGGHLLLLFVSLLGWSLE